MNMQRCYYDKPKIQKSHSAAEKFDDSDPSVYNLCRKDYPDLLEELLKEPCQDVLDCGCGTGAMLVMFRDACPDKQYTGKEGYGINKFSFVLSKV